MRNELRGLQPVACTRTPGRTSSRVTQRQGGVTCAPASLVRREAPGNQNLSSSHPDDNFSSSFVTCLRDDSTRPLKLVVVAVGARDEFPSILASR